MCTWQGRRQPQLHPSPPPCRGGGREGAASEHPRTAAPSCPAAAAPTLGLQLLLQRCCGRAAVQQAPLGCPAGDAARKLQGSQAVQQLAQAHAVDDLQTQPWAPVSEADSCNFTALVATGQPNGKHGGPVAAAVLVFYSRTDGVEGCG